MIIQFSFRNFRTFREKATLSLVASGYDKETREDKNVAAIKSQKLRLLKSAVVYGANASGKTKLVEAMSFMKNLVRQSGNEQKGDPISVEPFLLDDSSQNESSEFEMIFLYKNVRYRYGFEVSRFHVVAEWLYHKPKDTEVEVFYRDEEGLNPHARIADFRIGRKLASEGMIKENTLWLTAAAQWNDAISGRVLDWFHNFQVVSGIDEYGYMGYTLSQLNQNTYMSESINDLVRAASIGLEEIVINKLSIDDLPNKMPTEIRERITREVIKNKGELIQDTARYPVYDKAGNRVAHRDFPFDEHESSGTRKFLALSGPILDVLANGHVLVVDELDAHLHPNLVCKLIALFNSKTHNPLGAQLIFTTQDTNLLDSGYFRRDQIWFTEKDRYGAATLYPLTKYTPRKGEDLEKNYILGNYGAIPYLGDFDNLPKLTANENEG